MNTTKYYEILFYSQLKDVDELVISLIAENLSAFLVSDNPDEIKAQINTPIAKVILISCEHLKQSIEFYNELLDEISQSQLLNHKVVFLVHKKEEKEADEAHLSGLADDYLVSKPLHDKHSLISIVRHLLIELGKLEHAPSYSLQEQPDYTGYNRKKNAIDKFTEEMATAALDVVSLTKDVQSGEFELDKLAANFTALSGIFKQYQSSEQKSSPINLIVDLIALSETCLTMAAVSSVSGSNKKPISKNYKFLLVEDDPWSAKLVGKILESDFFELDMVADGRSAIQRIQAIHYDLILMDIDLPDSDGAMLTSQLRKNPGDNKATPVIMLTGSNDQNTIKRCALNKIQGYLVKPISKEHLLQKLSEVLEVEL